MSLKSTSTSDDNKIELLARTDIMQNFEMYHPASNSSKVNTDELGEILDKLETVYSIKYKDKSSFLNGMILYAKTLINSDTLDHNTRSSKYLEFIFDKYHFLTNMNSFNLDLDARIETNIFQYKTINSRHYLSDEDIVRAQELRNSLSTLSKIHNPSIEDELNEMDYDFNFKRIQKIMDKSFRNYLTDDVHNDLESIDLKSFDKMNIINLLYVNLTQYITNNPDDSDFLGFEKELQYLFDSEIDDLYLEVKKIYTR